MTDLDSLALRLAKDGPEKTLPTPRQIQALFNGAYIVRTTESTYVWEVPYYPQLYIPESALTDVVTIGARREIKFRDTVIAHQLNLLVGDVTLSRVIRFSDDLPGPARALQGLIKIDFAAVDQWFEESTPIYVHPKDPFKRVDILASTRPIKVCIDGEVVADSTSSMHLYETGLPPRYYLPITSLRADILRRSETRTQCPYKGVAEYYSVELSGKVYKDIVWYYRHPLLECAKIEGLCCFYNEKVDIRLDN